MAHQSESFAWAITLKWSNLENKPTSSLLKVCVCVSLFPSSLTIIITKKGDNY